jgi:pantoate--beta-alanine ligase
MKVIQDVAVMQMLAERLWRRGRSIGFVPTMGALHEGHLTLARRARRENDVAVVSIFVNPLQFGPAEDFKRYPRTLKNDLALLRAEKVDLVFIPSAAAIYPSGFSAQVRVPALDGVLEGVSRPGHFSGVATVVLKLFNIVRPTRAYFGEKDYQQARVIRKMIKDLNLPVHLVACPTVREADGLALSSRNRYLSRTEREEAVKIYQTLYLGRELVTQKIMRRASSLIRRLTEVLAKIPRSRVDYVAVVDPDTLEPMNHIRRPALLAIAVRIGKTRLIDNVVIP